MSETLHILLVEDNAGDARIVQEYLKEDDSAQFNLYRAISLFESLEILSDNKIDIILSDLGLPDSQGIETFLGLKKSSPNIPIIIFTGLKDNELGLEAVKMGAEDYLVKGQVEQQHLIRSIKYAVERKKAENKHTLILQILHILNRPNEWDRLVKDILFEMKKFSGIEAVAIRIQNGDDFPYFDTNGFSPDFIESERSLCIKDIKGNIRFDSNGKPKLACMCGTVISEHTNSKYTYFTEAGSFWTNSTTKLLASTTEEDRQGTTRNHCNKEGYESVALIPVISGKHPIGLIQLNDKRTGRFTLELINFFEEIASTIGIAYKRVQIEKQVKESEEKYSKAFLTSPYAITITNPKDGKFIEVNHAFTSITGFCRQEALADSSIGLKLWDKIEDRNSVISSLFKGKEVNGKEFIFRKKNGDTLTGLFSAQIIQLNNETHILSSINDITDRKQTEEAILHERKLLRTLIENIPDSIYVKDIKGRKVITNPADIKFIGAKNESEILGKTDLELFPGKIGIRGHNDDLQIIKNGIPLINKNENFIDEEGRLLWLLTTKVPLFDEYGKTTGLVGIGHDITEQKRAEKELKTAFEKALESDRLKSSFLSTMSHELRTPLNAVIGFSSLIEKNTTLNDILGYSRIIHSSGNQLLEIVENILDFSLIETGIIQFKKSESLIVNIMKDIYSKTISKLKLMGKRGIEIRFYPEKFDQNLTLYSDQNRIHQILMLFIDNALKFTHKGTIEFGFSKIENEAISKIKFYVKDSGIGIPKDKQEIIFKMFRQVDDSNTREYGGTGLGLAIAKKLVEILGGEIGVESNLGEGSTFYFSIPIDQTV